MCHHFNQAPLKGSQKLRLQTSASISLAITIYSRLKIVAIQEGRKRGRYGEMEGREKEGVRKTTIYNTRFVMREEANEWAVSSTDRLFFLIGVQLFHNVMLVSTVQRSGVPCAIQQVLISYLFYTYQCIHVNPSLPIHPTTTPRPPAFLAWCPYVCSLHLCLYFCLANGFVCTI